MAPAGDLIRSIGDGISGLIGGSISAIAAGVAAIVERFQVWLPGPLFPIAAVVLVVLLGLWLLRK